MGDRVTPTHCRSFARRYRLARSAEIRALIGSRAAKRRTDRYFRVTSVENTLGHPRLCLGIPRRYARRAVERNLTKRIIRESFRHRRNNLPRLDILVTVHYPVHTLKKQQLREALEVLWGRML